MVAFRERIAFATALLAGLMLIQGSARGENAGCMNQVCKDINIYRVCTGGANVVRKYITCIPCKSGRCDTGNTNNRTCDKDTDQEQKFKFLQTGTSEICDCANAPNGTFAERTGSYTDDNWNDTTVKQRLCLGS